MSKIELDNWFLSDKRFKDLLPSERLILLLVATSQAKLSATATLSSRSGYTSSIVSRCTDKLLELNLIERDRELFYLATKNGAERKDIVLKRQDNPDYIRVVEALFMAINQTAPSGAKERKPKHTDYDQIRLMVENDGVNVDTLLGILRIYTTIPFWGEKFIVQSARSFRSHWLKIFESAQAHYTKNRIEKI